MIGRIGRRMFGSTKRTAVSIVCGVALAAASFAFAAWLISATGPGGGQVGNLQAPTVEAGTSAPNEPCYPGKNCGVQFKITNPNSGDLTITGITPTGTGSVYDTNATCQSSAPLTMNGQIKGLSINVPGNQTTTIEVPDAVSLSGGASSACQGTTFTTPNVTVDFQAGS